MTAEELKTLGERAVACAAWRWLPGMKVYDHRMDIRVFAILETSLHVASTDDRGGFVYTHRPNHSIPDISDPATRGAVLELVREAHQDPACSTAPEVVRVAVLHWQMWDYRQDIIAEESTEMECLVAAEARREPEPMPAPRREG